MADSQKDTAAKKTPPAPEKAATGKNGETQQQAAAPAHTPTHGAVYPAPLQLTRTNPLKKAP